MQNKSYVMLRAAMLLWLFFAMVQLPWWIFAGSLVIAAAWYGGWELLLPAVLFDLLYFRPDVCCSGFLATAATTVALVLFARIRQHLF